MNEEERATVIDTFWRDAWMCNRIARMAVHRSGVCVRVDLARRAGTAQVVLHCECPLVIGKALQTIRLREAQKLVREVGI